MAKKENATDKMPLISKILLFCGIILVLGNLAAMLGLWEYKSNLFRLICGVVFIIAAYANIPKEKKDENRQ